MCILPKQKVIVYS